MSDRKGGLRVFVGLVRACCDDYLTVSFYGAALPLLLLYCLFVCWLFCRWGRVQSRGYIGRYCTYTGNGFQEGVSLTAADEVIRLRKYAYGSCEIMLNQFVVGRLCRVCWAGFAGRQGV